MPGRIRLLALTAVLLAAAAVPAHEAAAAETDGWRPVRSPDIHRPYSLTDVAAIGGADAIGVGHAGDRGSVVLRGTGGRWKADNRLPAENPPSNLSGVDASGPNNIWAVGATVDEATSRIRPIAEQWDGRKWRAIPGLADPSLDSEFFDVAVASSSMVWAVGNELAVPPLSPIAQRWDGQRWTRFPLPHPFNTFVEVLSVEAVGPNDVWAAGHGRSGATLDLLPIAWHWNGAKWSYVLMPRLGAVQVTPAALLAVSATEVWAVGYKLVRLDDPGNLPAVERWDGTAWHEVSGPDVPAGAYPHATLDAITADGQGGIWAAGSTLAPDFIEPSFTSFFAHFENGSWTVQIEPDGMQGEIRGLTQLSGTTTLWAVGATRDRIGGCGPCRGLIGLLGPTPR